MGSILDELLDEEMGGLYLATGGEFFTLGVDALVVVDVVLPAVFGPTGRG